MLNSLYIQNYRNLKELKIDSVSRINLIAGKNNTGKTSLLEAIYLYATKANAISLGDILDSRGEYYLQNDSSDESIVKSLSSLFTNKNTDESIKIGELNEKTLSKEKGLELKIVNYIIETSTTELEEFIQKRKIISKETAKRTPNSRTGLDIQINNNSVFIDEKGDMIGNFFAMIQYMDVCFVTAQSYAMNEQWFDKIALTVKEDSVIDALKIIEPSAERIAFVVDNNSQKRKAIVKLSGKNEVLPLKSMGDGINRILTIILALVNSENSFLLIDEFENGLHYTVQEQLWKIIFRLAKNLNVQVFATTHNSDCIKGFSNALNEENNEITGKLIRLDNKNGEIKPEIISPEILKIATDQNIEIR